ncbi:alpha/beta fold hydrolase [Ornithinicoccus halotolerans]|uniref:alpha/beta fold hydrolase n=1 Tax=Ornithinicoccus halotolerans TaxID=1748220 RepID=UPI0012954B8A|nr:alpha/beta fold hydrolase [Ornithinicoccus halotolerans]
MSTPEEPALVLLPGLGLDGREWAGVTARLSGRTEAVLLPGLGSPAAKGTDLSIEAQALRVLAWLEQRLGDQPVVLVGHSEGCAVAVATAVRRASVAGLVLIGPVTDPRARSWPQTLQRWLRTARHERLGELRSLLPQYARTGLRSMLRGHHAMRWYPTGEAVARLTVPVVVVVGEFDRIPSRGWVDGLVTGRCRSLVVVARAGHMVPLTHPEAVAMAIHQVQRVLAGQR